MEEEEETEEGEETTQGEVQNMRQNVRQREQHEAARTGAHRREAVQVRSVRSVLHASVSSEGPPDQARVEAVERREEMFFETRREAVRVRNVRGFLRTRLSSEESRADARVEIEQLEEIYFEARFEETVCET